MVADEFNNRIVNLICAGCSGIWVECPDYFAFFDKRIPDIISKLKERTQRDWAQRTWTLDAGWSDRQSQTSLADLIKYSPTPTLPAVNVLAITSKLLSNRVEIIYSLNSAMRVGKALGDYFIFCAPTGQSPPSEMEHYLVTLHEPYPSVAELEEVARKLLSDNELVCDDSVITDAVEAAKGLTVAEAENIFSLSIIEKRTLDPSVVQSLKAEAFRSSGFIEMQISNEDFSKIGGLQNLKDFTLNLFSQKNLKVKPRGILLLGVPGCGKTAFARALSAEVGRPLLNLNVGALYGPLVGTTEQNIKKALQIADSMEPCILFIDEVEKALSGVASSGHTDSGVSARLFGTFLSWLNDHETDVFVIVTSNDIGKLPPEFYRSERFDALFFVDFPTQEERLAIWKIYTSLYDLDYNRESDALNFDASWTGAEIKACCRLSAITGKSVHEVSHYVVPIIESAKDVISNLRSWASGRCLDASFPGVFVPRKQANGRKLLV